MGPCREIYQEGLRIPPVKIVRAGTLDRDILALLLNNVRTPKEREGDLARNWRRVTPAARACSNFAGVTASRGCSVPREPCWITPRK